MVAAIERIKYAFLLKLSVRYIPSGKNITADSLSRGRLPPWLKPRGTRMLPTMRSLVDLINPGNLVMDVNS